MGKVDNGRMREQRRHPIAILSESELAREALCAAVQKAGFQVAYDGPVLSDWHELLDTRCRHVLLEVTQCPSSNLRQAVQRLNESDFIVIGVSLDRELPPVIDGLLRHGLQGFVPLEGKEEAVRRLLEDAVRGFFLCPQVDKHRGVEASDVSSADIDLIRALQDGCDVAGAAKRLGVAERTINNRISRLKQVLGVTTMFQLGQLVERTGLSRTLPS